MAQVTIPNIYDTNISFLITIIGQGLALFTLFCASNMPKIICEWWYRDSNSGHLVCPLPFVVISLGSQPADRGGEAFGLGHLPVRTRL